MVAFFMNDIYMGVMKIAVKMDVDSVNKFDQEKWLTLTALFRPIFGNLETRNKT